ncbi:MAG: hypothetical protein H7125_16675 [Proteobacteria bacterium]|nr:hypothetical protein [Burkholderiales bacterium]
MSNVRLVAACRWLTVAALFAACAPLLAAEQTRQIVLIQEMVIGLAPGQTGRLNVSPDVYPDFDASAVMLTVLDEAGRVLATTGRQPVRRSGPRFFSVAFAHTGGVRMLARFQYQLAGERQRGRSLRSAVTTTPRAPGTLEIVDAGAPMASTLLPVPSFTTSGTAASCALPSAPSLEDLAEDERSRDRQPRALAVWEFALVRVTDRQALELTLVDTVPAFVRREAELGIELRVLAPTGEMVIRSPASTLDGRSINHWVFGTELPRSAAGFDDFQVQFHLTCAGNCRRLAGWLADAQPAGPPLTPAVQVLSADNGNAVAIGLLVPAVQKIRDAAGGGGGGGGGTPPPPPPNS